MERTEWMWAVLARLEKEAGQFGWTDFIDQINVTRRVLTAESSTLLANDNIIRVDFKRRNVASAPAVSR